VRQIAEWLAKIGLSDTRRYLIANDIDVEVLRYLTDADLEKIGVSLGTGENARRIALLTVCQTRKWGIAW
jgi:SAM domain (Sterile alpha motif)